MIPDERFADTRFRGALKVLGDFGVQVSRWKRRHDKSSMDHRKISPRRGLIQVPFRRIPHLYPRREVFLPAPGDRSRSLLVGE